jgi:outer membrane lipoprotein
MFISLGCVKAISKEVRAQVDEEISIQQVMKNPTAFQGRMIIWGGAIVTAKNLKEGTVLEIVQKPLTVEERPQNVDRSAGRFLAIYEGYLDVAIYSKNREVTVAGRIKETQKRLLDEIEYTYPVVSVQEVYIWPPRDSKKYYISPHWHYWDGYYYPYRYYP